LADIVGHFAPIAALPLARDRCQGYYPAYDAVDVVRTLARSRPKPNGLGAKPKKSGVV